MAPYTRMSKGRLEEDVIVSFLLASSIKSGKLAMMSFSVDGQTVPTRPVLFVSNTVA